MANKQLQEWDGKERRQGDRRECLLHSKHEVLIDSFQRRLKTIDDRDYMPTETFKWWVGTYKWVTGVIVGIFVTLFSIAIYTAQTSAQALTAVTNKQATIISKIENLGEDISEVKQLHKETLRDIDSEFESVKGRLNKLEK